MHVARAKANVLNDQIIALDVDLIPTHLDAVARCRLPGDGKRLARTRASTRAPSLRVSLPPRPARRHKITRGVLSAMSERIASINIGQVFMKTCGDPPLESAALCPANAGYRTGIVTPPDAVLTRAKDTTLS